MARERLVPISGYKLIDGTTIMFEHPFKCPQDCEPDVLGTYMGDDKWRMAISWTDKSGKSFYLIRVAKEVEDYDFYFDEECE